MYTWSLGNSNNPGQPNIDAKWEHIIFSSGIALKNTYRNQYLYASSINYDSDRRTVWTWAPGNEVRESYWKEEVIGQY